jgi:uncharacterized membrane protein YphA (DoxX/SURF4 family)
MKGIVHLSRLLLGITFTFSGFVKGIDPWGSAYKFIDYFAAMGLQWLNFAAFPLGVLLAFTEVAIGIALFFNYRVNLFSWGALIFMIFFTPLTLWIAMENPVTDCGCFGDALVISNWATFYKNIILIAAAILLVIMRNKLKGYPGKKGAFVLSMTAGALYVFLVVYSVRHEPVFDFRPYKKGVNIPESMTIPADAPKDVYKNIFYYKNKKTGKIEKFDDLNYPWQDTLNWVFHSMDESVLVKKGYTPPIHGFSVESREGEDVSGFFLEEDKPVFMLIASNIKKSSRKNQGSINNLAKWAHDRNYPFICLTASTFEDTDHFLKETGAPYEFFHSDETELKTIVRANPGLILLKKGTVVSKYHHNDIPTPDEIEHDFPEIMVK